MYSDTNYSVFFGRKITESALLLITFKAMLIPTVKKIRLIRHKNVRSRPESAAKRFHLMLYVSIIWNLKSDFNSVLKALSRRHTRRFYSPIAANLIDSENRSPPINADTLGDFFADRGDVALQPSSQAPAKSVLKTRVINSPNLGPVVQRPDNFILWISHYPTVSICVKISVFPLVQANMHTLTTVKFGSVRKPWTTFNEKYILDPE